jgi:uncharacterized membrane protein SirB2
MTTSTFTNVHVVIGPALKAMAPTQSEPPFLVAQVIVLVLFIVLGVFAVKKFHPGAGQTA